jgi:hypothetical protein
MMRAMAEWLDSLAAVLMLNHLTNRGQPLIADATRSGRNVLFLAAVG